MVGGRRSPGAPKLGAEDVLTGAKEVCVAPKRFPDGAVLANRPTAGTATALSGLKQV